MKPFVVDAIGSILRFVNRFSIFEWYLTRAGGRGEMTDEMTMGALTECWIILNLLCSALALLLVSHHSPTALRVVLLLYTIRRLGGTLAHQAYTQVHGGFHGNGPRLIYQVLSYRRIIYLAGLRYVEMILWFASLYRSYSNHFHSTGVALDSVAKALYYSTVTMTTIGYGDVYPETRLGFLIVIAHSLTAVFMTVLILARIISYLPRPDTQDPAETDSIAEADPSSP